MHFDFLLSSGATDPDFLRVALATSWINAGQALRRAQDIGLHVRRRSPALFAFYDTLPRALEITEETSTQFTSERDPKAGLVVCIWA